jgi:hypothetical protein
MLTKIFWLFGKRLWFKWTNPATGRLRLETNHATFADLWRNRKYPVKVWVD